MLPEYLSKETGLLTGQYDANHPSSPKGRDQLSIDQERAKALKAHEERQAGLVCTDNEKIKIFKLIQAGLGHQKSIFGLDIYQIIDPNNSVEVDTRRFGVDGRVSIVLKGDELYKGGGEILCRLEITGDEAQSMVEGLRQYRKSFQKPVIPFSSSRIISD